MTSLSAKAAGGTPFPIYFKMKWQLYAMRLLPALIILLFNYVLLVGLAIAFEDYNPGSGGLFGGKFVGLKWFRTAMSMPNFPNIIRNTVTMAAGKIILGQVAAIPTTKFLGVDIMNRKIYNSFGDKAFQAVNYAVLTIVALTCLLPMLHVLAPSLSDSVPATANKVLFIPKGFNLAAYPPSKENSELRGRKWISLFFIIPMMISDRLPIESVVMMMNFFRGINKSILAAHMTGQMDFSC